MTIQPDQPNSPRHAQLKASWRPGQRWETLVEGCTQWVPVGDNGFAEPTWDHHQEYREASDAAPCLAPADLTMQEARRIVSEQDCSNPARTIEAVALVLRFEGIADASLLRIAGQLESVAGSLRSTAPGRNESGRA